jgi:hypothetical protein
LPPPPRFLPPPPRFLPLLERFLLAAAALLFTALAAAFLFLVRAAFFAAALRFAFEVAINFPLKHCVLCPACHEFLLNYSVFLTKLSSSIMFFSQKRGVECLYLAKNNDLFVSGLAGSFVCWIVYLRTDVQPPTKITVFEIITLFVNHLIYRWG